MQSTNDLRHNSNETLSALDDLSKSLLTLPPSKFLQLLTEKACDLLSAPICILWEKENKKPRFKVIATFGEIDEAYKRIKLDLGHPGVKHIFTRGKVLALSNINNATFRLADLDELNKRKWISFLSAPLKIEGEAIGILEIFTKKVRKFEGWEKSLFGMLANYASLSFQKTRLLKDKENISNIANDRDKLQALTATMLEITVADQAEDVWSLLKKGTSKLVDSNARIWIGRLNHLNGKLENVESNDASEIEFGKNITTKAIKEEKPIVANTKGHPETEAQISIPILIDKVPIREQLEVKLGSKRIGILNIESPETSSFSKADEERLLLLARHAALRIERIMFYQKLVSIREIEKKIIKQDYGRILKTVIKGITEILQFTWVNISLIDSDRTNIRSEHVSDSYASKGQLEKFKELAVHRLDSNDIQVDIVHSKQIKVPSNDDPGLDQKIFNLFGHKELVRVFIPMIEPSSNLVIGTVEVGYKKEYREHIYEQDVQILKSFVEYAVHALERKKSRLIDRITHELTSPIGGIKSHTSFLQRRFSDISLSSNTIAIKFEDILSDCDLLHYQVKQIGYFLGVSGSETLKLEPTFVFRDVIIKTISQLRSFIREEYNLSPDKIIYNPIDSKRIFVYTDKVRLNQVVYNLLINSAKYAEKDPEKFKILLEVEESKDNFVVKFKDWGIGITEENKGKIFQEGFRASDAIKKVGGSGLGLSISKAIMRQLGGKLELINNSKPTEFHLTLPKKSKETLNDSLR